jgi:predicted DNA-binding transcriptional regulator AlpA
MITLNLNSYDITEATVALIKLCYSENPELSNKAVAKLTGLSDRTIYRYHLKYNIYPLRVDNLTNKKRQIKIQAMTEFLRSEGYEVKVKD